MSSVNEIYQHGHHTSVVSSHAKRTAETDAAFFLPYLEPGMRLLDVGCGPGSISVGLALRVEPAPTVGMDASESVIETARSLAKAKPARYLTFEVGNIYEPHFRAENFDAIFAHQVLQHLRRPASLSFCAASRARARRVVQVRGLSWRAFELPYGRKKRARACRRQLRTRPLYFGPSQARRADHSGMAFAQTSLARR